MTLNAEALGRCEVLADRPEPPAAYRGMGQVAALSGLKDLEAQAAG
ncbi:MAG TPA: hypothetical protein VI455_13500 [Terriglobia bacterium]